MGRKDGPWVVQRIETVAYGWLKYVHRTDDPASCFWCDVDQENPLALLISVKYEESQSKPAGWFCESCARERNLIW